MLAHEISHIKNNDIKVMGMADTIMRVTHILSGIGKILLIVNMPLILVGKGSFSWLAVALLIFAPNLTTMLQLGLSRDRAYDADVGAVDLTKDPHTLASALQKLEKLHTRLLQKSFCLDGKFLSLIAHTPAYRRSYKTFTVNGRRVATR